MENMENHMETVIHKQYKVFEFLGQVDSACTIGDAVDQRDQSNDTAKYNRQSYVSKFLI